MCNTGKCQYEDRDGECILEFNEFEGIATAILKDAYCLCPGEEEESNEQNPSD